MKAWEEVSNVKALVEETLTASEVWDLVQKSRDPRYTVCVFRDVKLTDKFGTVHEGCLIQRGYKTVHYLFMERTWKEIDRYRHHVDAVPEWHRLLDITHLISKKSTAEILATLSEEDEKVCRNMLNAMRIVCKPVNGRPSLERIYSSDVEGIETFIRPAKECAEFDQYVEETVKGLVDGSITPFDDRWIDLLMGEIKPEQGVVFEALRRKGHQIYEVTGGFDRAGNIIKGISLDGIIVTGWHAQPINDDRR